MGAFGRFFDNLASSNGSWWLGAGGAPGWGTSQVHCGPNTIAIDLILFAACTYRQGASSRPNSEAIHLLQLFIQPIQWWGGEGAVSWAFLGQSPSLFLHIVGISSGILGTWFVWGSSAQYYLWGACTIQPLGTLQANILGASGAMTKPLVPLERPDLGLSNDISYTQIHALSLTLSSSLPPH